MAQDLLPNSSVLVGPGDYRPATVIYCDHEGVHVMGEDYGTKVVAREHVARVCEDDDLPEEGEVVLVEIGDAWVEATVVNTHLGNVLVEREHSEDWVPARCVARKAEGASRTGEEPVEAEPADKLSFGLRLRRFAFHHGLWVWLGFAALAPLFLLAQAEHAGRFALLWLLLHLALGACAFGQNRPLPRFYPAGFGKPDDPGTIDKSKLERPPLRSKWELTALVVPGWFMLPIGLELSDFPVLIPALYVAAVALIAALLVYLHDRNSATETRRLLAHAPVKDHAGSGIGLVSGTASGERGDAPLRWREVLVRDWAITRQVNKTITDSDGNTRSVVANETTHYRCGVRSEGGVELLSLDTDLGPVEVPLSRATWASTRELWFGDYGQSRGREWRRKPGRKQVDITGGAVERIDVGDRVIVAGKLETDRSGRNVIAGTKAGPALLFSAGADDDPRARLSRLLLRRRALIGLPVLAALVCVALALV